MRLLLLLSPLSYSLPDRRPNPLPARVLYFAERDTTTFSRPRALTRNRYFGQSFFDWGGFYAPTAEDPRPVPEDMAAALEKWREFTMNDPRRAQRSHPAGEDGEGPGLGEGGGTQVWRQAEAAQRAEEEEQARREEMEVMLRGAEDPAATTEPAIASSTTEQGVGAHTAEAVEAVEAAEVEDAEKAPRLSRKEQILARARIHAKTPAPEVLDEEEAVERVVKTKAEKKQKEEAKAAETSTLRERLLKLMGGKWL